MKIIDKRGEVNLNQWMKMVKAIIVSIDGAIGMLGANACTA
jgi:hypothetical protein